MKTLSITRIATNALLALIIGFVASLLFVVNPVIVAAATFTIGTGGQLVAPYLGISFDSRGVAFMAIQTEVWVRDIQENLFFENEFINLAINHSSHVNNIKVHVPQAGAVPNVVVNRTAVETTPVQRTDTDLEYTLSNFTTDPILVKDIEELQTAYNKRQSVMGSHTAALNEKIAIETLYSWATDTDTAVVNTSGSATDTDTDGVTPPHATATGTRNRLVKSDLATAAAKMDIQKAPKSGRFAIIPTNMFYGLFEEEELILSKATLGKDMESMGVIAQLYGFNIIVRGEVVIYDENNTGITLTASTDTDAATDCSGAVCYSRFMVSQALGAIKVFLNVGEAKSYGDVMSAEVNHGAAKLRTDEAGIVCIRQFYIAPI